MLPLNSSAVPVVLFTNSSNGLVVVVVPWRGLGDKLVYWFQRRSYVRFSVAPTPPTKPVKPTKETSPWKVISYIATQRKPLYDS